MLRRAGSCTGKNDHPLPRASRPGLRPFRSPSLDLICRIPPPFQPGNRHLPITCRPTFWSRSRSLGRTTASSIPVRPEGIPAGNPTIGTGRIGQDDGIRRDESRAKTVLFTAGRVAGSQHMVRSPYLACGGGNKRTALEGTATAYSGAPLPHAGAESGAEMGAEGRT